MLHVPNSKCKQSHLSRAHILECFLNKEQQNRRRAEVTTASILNRPLLCFQTPLVLNQVGGRGGLVGLVW